MAFEEIKPGGSQPIQMGPAAPPDPKKEPPAANFNTISQEDALKGADHAKMNTFSVTDLSGKPNPPGTPGSSVSLGGLVQGKVAVDLMDSLIPSLIVLLFHKAGMAIKKSDMQMTVGEKNTLAPIVEACMNTINLDFSNPWTALTVSLAIIYGGKAIEKGGAAWIDKKSGAGAQKEPAKAAPTGPAPMTVVKPPAPSPIPDSKNTDSFVPERTATQAGLREWTEEDVKLVDKKRRKGPAEARRWLGSNWVKKGGVI